MNINIDEARCFLKTLYGDAAANRFIEFRLIGGKGDGVIRTFRQSFQLDDDTMQEFAAHNVRGRNIYFGVALRDITYCPDIIPALWLDVDFKTLKSNSLLDKQQKVVLSLLCAAMPPQMVVQSGHGIHAYWLINPVGADIHTRVSELNQKLEMMFRGDSVSDVARILRLPGYYNVKDMDNPVPCKVLTSMEPGISQWRQVEKFERYDLRDLDNWLIQSYPDTLSDANLEQLIKLGNMGQYPTRSEADFAVCLALTKKGIPDREIRQIFVDNPEGIGAKYYDHENGDRYLRFTIKKARKRGQ